MDSNSGFQCFICNQFIEGEYTSLTKHFRNSHYMSTSNSSRVYLKCGQNGCNETFEYFAPFRHHLQVCDKIKKKVNAENDIDFRENLVVMHDDAIDYVDNTQFEGVVEEQERIKKKTNHNTQISRNSI